MMKLMEDLVALVNELRRLPLETEWVEFKRNNYDPNMIGSDISALANGSALAEKHLLIWCGESTT
jgi:hypothetical protein